MKTLFLARHAKSSWDRPGLPDFDRPLNARGERDAPTMGGFLAGLDEPPEAIVSSPAVRAAATARAFAKALGIPEARISWNRSLYAASPGTILAVVGELDDGIGRALVVGHNPGMTQLAGDLAPGSVSHMPTCSIAAIELPARSWMAVRPGSGRLRFFETPKSLAR